MYSTDPRTHSSSCFLSKSVATRPWGLINVVTILRLSDLHRHNMCEVETFYSPPVNASHDHIVDDVSEGAAHVLCLIVHPPTYLRAYFFPYSDIKYTPCPILSPTPIPLLVTNSSSAHRPHGFAHTTQSQ